MTVKNLFVIMKEIYLRLGNGIPAGWKTIYVTQVVQ